MVCVLTPKSILDDEDRDVFEEIIPDSEAYHLQMRTALWSAYKWRGIGSCDVDYWVDCMQARYFSISDKYRVAWEMFTKFINDDKSFADSAVHSRTVVSHEDNPDNPQDDTVYLSDRTTTEYDGETFGGLGSTTAAEYLRDIPNLPEDFAREFRELFYWGV